MNKVRDFFRTIALFNPQGAIAMQERNLMIVVVFLMLIVAIPMLITFFVILRKYRASNNSNTNINTKTNYIPDQKKKTYIILLWWMVMASIILIISIINWKSTHELDPYNPIVSNSAPITIQVVALNWKWLFIYPEQGIATVNFLEIPEQTPVRFQLTADGPMNSFWIPQLGGQMYAMPGMSTELNLIANTTGNFFGSAAEINGSGFSGMKFITHSVSQNDFDQWVASVKNASTTLTFDGYKVLAEPSENNPIASYSSIDQNLYNEIMAQFMPAKN